MGNAHCAYMFECWDAFLYGLHAPNTHVSKVLWGLMDCRYLSIFHWHTCVYSPIHLAILCLPITQLQIIYCALIYVFIYPLPTYYLYTCLYIKVICISCKIYLYVTYHLYRYYLCIYVSSLYIYVIYVSIFLCV